MVRDSGDERVLRVMTAHDSCGSAPTAFLETLMPSKSLLFFICACLASVAASAQNTQAHWSSYFGRVGADVGMVVKRGPGSLITVVGHTDSDLLGTAGTHKQFIGPPGNIDAFVARFDMSQPPALQKLWCTYFGGNAMELAFDAEVDAAGGVTIVGLTFSDAASFVVLGGVQATRKGASDGFIARFTNAGVLSYSTYFGSNADDRICAIEQDANGVLTVAGVAEGPGLLVTPGALFSTHQGGSDAFVARIDPAAPQAGQVVWSTYIGGPLNEGPMFSAWAGWNVQWEGMLDAIALHAEPGGSIVLATASQSTTLPTTPGCLQPVHTGGLGAANIYLARLASGATVLQYGSFLGAPGTGVRDMAPHPAGGYVLVGQTFATNMVTTAGCYQSTYMGGPFGGTTEGCLHWIAPALPASQQLRYASYVGGNGGEDAMLSVAVESSGIVTVAGYLSGGFTLRSTPGALQPTSNAFEYTGYLARMAMEGNMAQDLLYATYLGDFWTVMQSVTLDDLGDAIVAGMTYGPSYPTTVNACQPTHGGPGLRDAVITHVPLLAGGTTRFNSAFATPACTQPLYHGVFGTPNSLNTQFGLTATNAPPAGFGVLAFDVAPLPVPVAVPLPGLGIHALVSPTFLVGTGLSYSSGFARYPLSIPASLPPGFTFDSQWLFLTNTACPGTGVFATSEGLRVTTL